jgi:hypothetical protein
MPRSGLAYDYAMKFLKETLRMLVSSSLLWLGTAGAVASFLTYYLMSLGYFNPIANALHFDLYADPFSYFFCAFLVGICFAIAGIIVGIVRLFRKLRGRTSNKTLQPAQGATL